MQAKVSFADGARDDTTNSRNSAYYRFSERRLTMELVSYHAIERGEEILMSCRCTGY